jgi:hypothetical protein
MIQAHRMGAMKEFTAANDQNAVQFAMTEDLTLAAQLINGIY